MRGLGSVSSVALVVVASSVAKMFVPQGFLLLCIAFLAFRKRVRASTVEASYGPSAFWSKRFSCLIS